MTGRMRCDTVIVGGGSSGAVLAALLSEARDHRVILLEAGPDFGPCVSGVWPAALLDGRGGWTADAEWEFWNEPTQARDAYPLACGKAIGGSSAINAGGFNWPCAADLARWVACGNPAWGFADMLPHLRAIEADPEGPGDLHGRGGPLPVLRPAAPLDPFFTAFAAAAATADYTWRADINDASGAPGLMRRARNVRHGVRWNAAFAWLDPARSRGNLRILDRTRAIRIACRGGRATGIEAIGAAGGVHIDAGRVIVAAGAYNTPALLLRSGIGPAPAVRAHGIPVVADLPGVGQNLMDHPVVTLRLLLSEPAARQAARTGVEPFQVVLRACLPDGDRFALQLAPAGAAMIDDGWEIAVRVELMQPRARGHVRLRAAAPEVPPMIDSCLLADAGDAADMARGVDLLRDLLARDALRAAVARERWAGTDAHGAALGRILRRDAYSYHHPCGTCRMGSADQRGSVVGENGGVHGIAGLFVADASIMPAIPAVPLHHLVLAVAHRIGVWLAA